MSEKSIIKSIPLFEDDNESKFVCAFPDKDEIHLYTVDNNQDTAYSLISKKNKISSIKCICSSPSQKNTIAIGETTGDALILNLDNEISPIRFPTKQQRVCNAVALNFLGDLAVGLEKIRNESSLIIWNIHQSIGSNKKMSPIQQLGLSEPVFSLSYFPDSPKQLISGVNLRWIKIFDLREKSSVSATTFYSTRFIHNITIDPKNSNYFASTSDEGLVSIWDRRKNSNGEPCLLLNRGVNQSSQIIDLKFTGAKPGQLSGLSKEGVIKLWDINYNYDNPDQFIVSFYNNKKLSEISEPSTPIKSDSLSLMYLREGIFI